MNAYPYIFLFLVSASGSFLFLDGVTTEQKTAEQQSEPTRAADTIVQDSTFDPNNIQSPTIYNDTLFLRRNVNKQDDYTSYNYVYLDTNRSAPYYHWLTSFEFSDYDVKSLKSYGVENLSCADDILPNSISGLPKNWLPLYSLNGEYVVYTPSDFGNAGRRILSEDYFIYWYMDGPMPFKIMATKKISIEPITLVIKNFDGYPEQIFIHCIDEQRQIYVFEKPSNSEKYRYQFYIPAERAKDFDMVVNTGNEKAWEYEFDTVDFESLIEK